MLKEKKKKRMDIAEIRNEYGRPFQRHPRVNDRGSTIVIRRNAADPACILTTRTTN